MDAGLLGDIYEAAIHADRWPDVLHRVATSYSAKGGVLHVHKGDPPRWRASPSVEAIFAEYLAAEWHIKTDRVTRGIQMNWPGFITDTDLYTEAEIAVHPLYQGFLAPRGVQAVAGTHIGCATDGELILTIWGFPSHASARDQIPTLNELRPHLARASMVAAQLQLDRARSAVETLALINVPSAILGQRRRVLASNAQFNMRLSNFAHDTPTGLRLSDINADAVFGSALAKLEDVREGGISLPLRLAAEQRAVLHVLPVRGAARDLMAGARALLVLTSPRLNRSLSLALIQGLFDLTPAEAMLARHLSESGRLDIAAERLCISEGTARQHLKSVFRKTGAHSQPELLILLGQYGSSIDLG